MAESELGAQAAGAVSAALASAAGYLALVTQNNPLGTADQLLARPDVDAVLLDALDEARAQVEYLVQEGWYREVPALPGGSAQLGRLLGDVGRIFDALARLRGLMRRAHASVPPRRFIPGVSEPGSNPVMEASAERAEAVRQAVLGWGRLAALRARMTVSVAEGAARTLAVLQAAHGLRERGEPVLKRWRAHADSPSCCYWCRRLDGVAIPLRASFAPYLGGPARMPQASPRWVRTGAGERKFGQRAGTRIIYTDPPRLYHGDLQGPLLHPFCRCWLELTRGETRGPAGHHTGIPAGYLSSEDIWDLPEERYQAQMAFLRAAVHELGLVLRRLAEGRNG